jgi:hypothetical protein
MTQQYFSPEKLGAPISMHGRDKIKITSSIHTLKTLEDENMYNVILKL